MQEGRRRCWRKDWGGGGGGRGDPFWALKTARDNEGMRRCRGLRRKKEENRYFFPPHCILPSREQPIDRKPPSVGNVKRKTTGAQKVASALFMGRRKEEEEEEKENS